MQLSPRQVINLIHIMIIGPLLVYVGVCGKKCPHLIYTLLLALGIGVISYHAYLLIKSVKETFIHSGGYLGRPEPFVPFSYPYNVESERYYSMHDTQHNSGCNCQHKLDCQCGCHQGAKCNCHHQHHAENNKEGFMLPNFGMEPVVPKM
jgi:hypothetical protein